MFDEAFGRLDRGHRCPISEDECAEFGQQMRCPSVRSVHDCSCSYHSSVRVDGDPAIFVTLRDGLCGSMCL